jgi:hypothetical protein
MNEVLNPINSRPPDVDQAQYRRYLWVFSQAKIHD